MHVAALRHPAYRRLSSEARWTFVACIGLAGECDLGGLLEIRGVGSMTVAEIADVTGLPLKSQQKALDDVVAIGWMGQEAGGSYRVERFDEKAGRSSEDDANAERQRRYRDRQRNVTRDVTITHVTNDETVTDKEEEEEEYILFAAAFVGAVTGSSIPPTFPDGTPTWLAVLGEALNGIAHRELRSLTYPERVLVARGFAAVFANYRIDESKNAKRGATLATSIARLGATRNGDMRVKHFFRYGFKVLKTRGFFHAPGDVEAAIEYVTA